MVKWCELCYSHQDAQKTTQFATKCIMISTITGRHGLPDHPIFRGATFHNPGNGAIFWMELAIANSKNITAQKGSQVLLHNACCCELAMPVYEPWPLR